MFRTRNMLFAMLACLACLTISSLQADEKPAKKPDAKLEKKQETKPAKKPDAKPAKKQETKPAKKPVAKPAKKPDAKPAKKPDAKPAKKPDAKPAKKPVAKPAKKPVAKPAKKQVAVGQISYYSKIRPIFQVNCQGCHQPAKSEGGYVMTNFQQMLKGGESEEPAIVPGKPGDSQLLVQITPDGDEAAMPKNKKPLSLTDITLISTWIAQGAKDDTPASTRLQYDMAHPPVYNAPPVITSLEFSPDGKWLAVSGYHEVVLHKADGSGIAARLVGMSERIESAVFSPDGKWLAVTGGSPGRMGEFQIWNVEKKTLKMAQTVGYDTIYGASWSADGKLLAIGCPDNSVRAFDTTSGKQVLYNGAHSDWVLDTVFSVKSDHLITVSRDRSMKLIKIDTQRFIDNITSITPGALQGGLHGVDRHPTKDELLVAGSDGVPKIYKMVREKARKIGDDYNLIRKFDSLTGRIFDAKFSFDGQRIVAGSSFNGSGQIKVFNAADGKEICKIDIPQGGIFAVAFSKDGKVVAAGGFDGQIRLIDAASGKIIKQFVPVEIKDNTVAAAEKK